MHKLKTRDRTERARRRTRKQVFSGKTVTPGTPGEKEKKEFASNQLHLSFFRELADTTPSHTENAAGNPGILYQGPAGTFFSVKKYPGTVTGTTGAAGGENTPAGSAERKKKRGAKPSSEEQGVQTKRNAVKRGKKVTLARERKPSFDTIPDPKESPDTRSAPADLDRQADTDQEQGEDEFYREEQREIDSRVKEIQAEMPSACNTFFSAVSKYPLLTPEQEHELALKIRNDRDPEAFNLFLMSNMRLALACVRDVMRRMGGNTILEFMDLAQEAVLGLMTAVERFDPTRGTRFSTYGLYWIYQRVKRAIVSQRKGISVPGYAGESVFAMTDYILLYKQGKEEEIPKKYRNRVRDLARITNHMMAFGETPDSEGEGCRSKPGLLSEDRFADSEKDSSNCFLGDEIMTQFFIDDFHNFLNNELTEYEADLLRRKFGLEPYNIPASHKEIGRIYGKSSETIRLNIESILKKVRKNKRAEYFMAAWLKQN